MSGGDDKGAPSEPSTEIAEALASSPPEAASLDPWTDLTPGDPAELADLEPEPEPPPTLAGFVSGDAGPAEVTGAEVEVADEPPIAPSSPPRLASDLALGGTLGPAAPPEWADEEPEPETFMGDGPFAAPVDGPPSRGTSRFTEALRDEPPPRWRAEPAPAPRSPPAPDKALVPAEVKAELERPHRLERRPSVVETPRTVADMRRAAPMPGTRPEPPTRSYPKMRALLQDPDAVPYGLAAPTPAASAPVPGTFFPTPRAPAGRPSAVDLDDMLLTMAEGLLIGESADGGTEVRVTLRDEFFAGTELRISIGEGRIHATLVPPDRDIYWQLNGHASDLEARLSDRGLRVASIQVLEPGA